MAKKSFKSAPVKTPKLTDKQIADFTKGGAGTDNEPTRRLSLDLPKELHIRFKTACSSVDTKMTREVMAFIEKRTKELESTPN